MEDGNGFCEYEVSKENWPLPIVKMSLFMDDNGIQLAVNRHKGNSNNHITLKPIEQQIIKNFVLSQFIACTDARLLSTQNKKFNDK